MIKPNKGVLQINRITAGYSGGDVIHDVSITVSSGTVVVILGANGAGKSTLLRCVSGLLRPTSGETVWGDRRINGIVSHKIAHMGIAHVPEGRGIFGELTVCENLNLGLYGSARISKSEADLRRQDVYRLFPRLEERHEQAGGTLSGGEQQMLAIGRGLMANPGILLLDEPSLGLAPVLVREVLDRLSEIKARGVGVLMVDQNARAALSVADYVYVMSRGCVVQEGAPEDLQSEELMRQAYLGELAE